MRKIFLVLMAVVVLFGVACSKKEEKQLRIVEPSETDYEKDLDINSPEGLAKASSIVYKRIAAEKMTIEEAVEELKSYASVNSLNEMEKRAAEFKKGIKEYVDYMKENNDWITGFQFGKTVYTSPEEAYIERIQKHKKGKHYYFRQDYVLEDGKWRISGDNVENPFEIKDNF